MNRELLLKLLEASGVWLDSQNAYTQLRAEYVQCHIRLCLVSAEIEDPRRAYTKKEMSYMRKKQTALMGYENAIEKQIKACYPGTTLTDIFEELRGVINAKRLD